MKNSATSFRINTCLSHTELPVADTCAMLVWAISRTDLDKVDAKLNRAFVATPAASMIEATASSFEDELCFVALLLLLLLL